MQMGGMPLINPGMIVRGSPSVTSGSEVGVAPSTTNFSNVVPPNYMDMYPQIYQPAFNSYFAHHPGSQGSHHTGILFFFFSVKSKPYKSLFYMKEFYC